MLMMTCFSGLLLPWLTFASNSAPDGESHDHIRDSVRLYLTGQAEKYNLEDYQVQIGQLDSRLKLSKCKAPLDIQMRNNSLPGNLSVSVSCTSDQMWKIYIQATVHAFKPIYVAKSIIRRGEKITRFSVELVKHNITALNGRYITDITRFDGSAAKRYISKGQIIMPVLLTKSKLIKRGESVTIIAETSGVIVRMKGKALNDAAAGEQVRVKNLHSKRVIEGIAIKRGQVKVNML